MGVKQTLLLLPIIFMLVLPIPNPALANSPKLFLPVTYYDFGKIPEGRVVEHVFILKNTDKTPLEIISVTPDCNCTKIHLSVNQIKPGEQVELIITFYSQGQRGSFT